MTKKGLGIHTEELLQKRYPGESGISALPGTLDDYLAKVVAPTLEPQKKTGAAAVHGGPSTLYESYIIPAWLVMTPWRLSSRS
jgi:hypothetical protein